MSTNKIQTQILEVEEDGDKKSVKDGVRTKDRKVSDAISEITSVNSQI